MMKTPPERVAARIKAYGELTSAVERILPPYVTEFAADRFTRDGQLTALRTWVKGVRDVLALPDAAGQHCVWLDSMHVRLKNLSPPPHIDPEHRQLVDTLLVDLDKLLG